MTVCGPGKTILNTWRSIDRERFHVLLATTAPTPDRPNALLEKARGLGAPVLPFGIGRGVDLTAVWHLVRLLRRHRIDIVQTHDAQTRRIAVIASALTGVPHVTSVHGWISNNRKEDAAKWLDVKVIRHADAVIAVSDRLRSDLEAGGVEPATITVLHNAIVLDDYRIPPVTAADGADLDRPVDRPVVSIVGRLSPEKGHAVFLEAARLVANEVPGVRFLVVGEGPLRQSLTARTQELGLGAQVEFTGHRSDLADIYGMTDVLVISSFTEGVPNVLLEAFAYSKPAVATAVGGVPEVLRDGETGRLVAPGDAAAIAARVVELLKDPRERRRMGRAGRLAVEQYFDFATRTRALERLYVDILGDRRGDVPARRV
jgi:glycosyltransferase involved in cell wall biosynthesis